MGARQIGWRLVYEALAARVRRPEWSFMNYGYAPSAAQAGAERAGSRDVDDATPGAEAATDGDVGAAPGGAGAATVRDVDATPGAEAATAGHVEATPGADDVVARLELEERDEPDRLCIQLYRRAIGDAEVRGADVLEVGSGRGGGASYVARYLEPRSMTGLDFSRAAIALCRRNLHVPGLSFVHGDALAMPLPDNSFDVVVNIESSHCYASMETFLAEVHRVLRPGGTFCWVDLRGEVDASTVHRELAASPLTVLAEEEITDGVLAALRLDDARKVALIEAWFPRVLHGPLHRFAGTARSRTFDRFEKRELRYLSAQATKTGADPLS